MKYLSLIHILSKFFKLSCLYCRGMCTQKLFRIYVKGILHIPRRVILWYVGTLKVIAVSYTHLDVYKRQVLRTKHCCRTC